MVALSEADIGVEKLTAIIGIASPWIEEHLKNHVTQEEFGTHRSWVKDEIQMVRSEITDCVRKEFTWVGKIVGGIVAIIALVWAVYTYIWPSITNSG